MTGPEQLAIEELLRQRIGLDPASIGPKAINVALTRRMHKTGLDSAGEYLALVQSCAEELNSLIDQVVVTETWFFRDREPFVYLEHFIRETWLPSNPTRALRALSIPCSTGEEPYSMAISFRQAGLPTSSFWIDAVDISTRALIKARRGKFRRHSFRGLDTSLISPFIRQVTVGEEQYEVDESIRRRVSFAQGNVFELPPGEMNYDIVFCRNLLIYLDRSARERAVRIMARFLGPDGLLFVGQSEKSELLSHGCVPVNSALSCFKRCATGFNRPRVEPLEPGLRIARRATPLVAAGETRDEGIGSREAKDRSKERAPRRDQASAPRDRIKTGPVEASAQAPNAQSRHGLTAFTRASELADRGVMQEALELCEAYLQENQMDVNAYVLLGQVRQSLGELMEAEQCFHKAIFLDPNHFEALTHLYLLKEHQGDMKGAGIIRKRLARVVEG